VREATPAEAAAIATHPKVAPLFLGDAPDWQPRFGDGLCWVIGEGIVWFFHRHHGDWWEIHVGALPEARETTKAQSLEAIRWFVYHKGAKYLTGCVKDTNEPGLRIARAVGMREVFKFPGHVVFGLDV